MPENKIIPIQIAGGGYTTPLTDIGSGYAAGISSAGKSIAGAISGVMGGVDAAGNVTHGVLEQNQTANDMLGFLSQQKDSSGNPVLSGDAYNSIMGKSLGAKQQVVGAMLGQFQTNYQSQLEQRNKLEAIQAQGGVTMQERNAAEAAATARAQAQLDLEKKKLLLDPKYQPIKIIQ